MCVCPWGRGRTVTGVNQGSLLWTFSSYFPPLVHLCTIGLQLAQSWLNSQTVNSSPPNIPGLFGVGEDSVQGSTLYGPVVVQDTRP